MTARILVPFDESTQSNFALRYALRTYPDEEIHVLHVSDPREWTVGTGGERTTFPDELAMSDVSGRALLERAEDTASEFDASVETELVVGPAAPTILRYAERQDVDHIVIGSHGRSGLSRMLHGSVAEGVIRRSHVPVTVLRTESGREGKDRGEAT
jgi:nucleotide-binding universal stress UspA family protein